MGDMADFALDAAMDDMESFWEWDSSGRDPQEGIDRGILNDFGGLEYYPVMPNTTQKFLHSVKVCGPGDCPKCGKETILKEGKFGKFYGCCAYPECNGSRSL